MTDFKDELLYAGKTQEISHKTFHQKSEDDVYKFDIETHPLFMHVSAIMQTIVFCLSMIVWIFVSSH